MIIVTGANYCPDHYPRYIYMVVLQAMIIVTGANYCPDPGSTKF